MDSHPHDEIVTSLQVPFSHVALWLRDKTSRRDPTYIATHLWEGTHPDQSMDTNKIQLGKPMGFTVAEMTQTVIPPKLTPTWVTAHKSWESGAHCTACRWLNRWKSVFSKWLRWSKPLPGRWSGLSILCCLSCLRAILFSLYCLCGEEGA